MRVNNMAEDCRYLGQQRATLVRNEVSVKKYECLAPANSSFPGCVKTQVEKEILNISYPHGHHVCETCPLYSPLHTSLPDNPIYVDMASANVEAPMKFPPPPDTPAFETCTNRGEKIRDDTSNLCGRVGEQIAIYSCKIHKECSLTKYCQFQTVPVCYACNDFQPPEVK